MNKALFFLTGIVFALFGVSLFKVSGESGNLYAILFCSFAIVVCFSIAVGCLVVTFARRIE